MSNKDFVNQQLTEHVRASGFAVAKFKASAHFGKLKADYERLVHEAADVLGIVDADKWLDSLGVSL